MTATVQTASAPSLMPLAHSKEAVAPVAHTPSTKDLLDLVTQRRSNYTLTPASTISDAEIQHILEVALAQAPSTFGSYTTRMVLAVRAEHRRLWDGITAVVKGVTPEDKWESGTRDRMAGFKNAYGTVLFFEDPTNTKTLQEQFAFAADKFPVWGQHTNAMHQFIVWTALNGAGLGASLQHYNPLVDDKVKELYGVPAHWELVAQLVFGTPSAPSHPKPVAMAAPMEDRLRVFGTDTANEDIIDEKEPLVDESLASLNLTKTKSAISAQ